VRFYSGKPVWATGKEKEKNLSVGFWAVFRAPAGRKVTLRVAASTVYRFFLNGNFGGYGPARGPHGHFRVDEWDLSEGIRPGENLVALEVAGYNVNSYYLLDQPSFLQAEVVSGEAVLAATGGSETRFEAGILPERVQKVQRYSFQRPFSEVYRLQAGYDLWRKKVSETFRNTDQSIFPAVKVLPRRVAYPGFFLRQPVWHVSEGRIETGINPKEVWKDRFLTGIGPKLKGFKEEELEVIPSIELQMVKTVPTAEINRPYRWTEKVRLGRNSFSILDFGTNLTGFLGAKVTCHRGTRLFFTFDEILSGGDVDFKRLSCVNIVLYEMPEGTFEVEAFEPYTLRFLKLIVLEGECEVENIYLREYASPDIEQAHFTASDERLNRLFAAGIETYRQNAVDIFTDCPSRERAGWLCDSLFTSRVACALAGRTIVEKNFFENFCLPDRFAFLPEGMLPMCYPADHYDGVFVPNWALWFVVQLEEYLRRSGDRELVDKLRPKVLRLFEYFRPFRNEDGLLEKLQGWVFVEWSHANDFVQDVNYPTNMLYAAALAAAARMYGLPELRDEAERIRTIIRKQSFDGEFFVDNAVRKDGKLTVTHNRSEVCQYMAFFFDVATPATSPALWSVLSKQFGPARKQTKAFPEVYEANAFVGNMLRLEILSRQGLGQQILEESIAYLLYMAERTGTLWENMGAYASCNHGFASHIVWNLYRDVLGLREVDSVNRVVRLRFSNLRLDWCEGRMPVAEGVVSLRWRRRGEKVLYRVDVPAGYTVEAENEGENWVREP
jgi:alpha-L-rhamnosidase